MCAKVDLLVKGQLRGPPKGISTNGTFEGVLFRVGTLVGHELTGACKVTIADIAGEKGIPQHALLILCWVTVFKMPLFTLHVTENNMALYAL